MPINCEWQTAQYWADLFAQDISMFDRCCLDGGPTYAHRCADGTMWINADLAYTLQGVQP